MFPIFLASLKTPKGALRGSPLYTVFLLGDCIPS